MAMQCVYLTFGFQNLMDVFRASNQKNYMKSSEMLSKSQISRFPGAGHPLPKGKTKKKEVQKRGLR